MLEIKTITKNMAYGLIYKNHYSKVMPKLNKFFLGCYFDDKLIGVITLGRGTRPLHTIKKLFPSLGTQDYYEIGKMCFDEEMPKNTESQYLALMISRVKKNLPNIKAIFTRADGMLGKPGYVYQASNFMYGGFIRTDTYLSDKGEKIHPRMTNKIGGRPTREKQKELGRKHYQGKQFRYIYFTCSKKMKRKLLSESTVDRHQKHPKEIDIERKIDNGEKYVITKEMYYNPDNRGFYLNTYNKQSLF